MNRFAAIRACYGTLLLVIPDPLIRLSTGLRADRTTRVMARLLGARHVAQALATLDVPSPVVLALGAEVDLAHSLSMLGLAGVDRNQRRAALTDAAIAGSFAITSAILTWHTARRCPPIATAERGLGARREAVAAAVASWVLPAGVRRYLHARCAR